MQILNQDIKNKEWKPVYLLYGEETFLKNSYKNRFREAAVGADEMNFARFEGKGLDVDELIRLADTMPFFSNKRFILVEDSGFFKGAPEELVSYLPAMPDSTLLIFVESEVDKRNRLFKKVKELGYAAELGRQNASALAKWAGGILAKEQKKITGNTMEFLLSRTGDDMEHIRMELEKLVSYTLGREIITTQDVEDICTVHVTNKIFDMVAAIVNRQTKKAMELYEDLLTLREPPMRILFLIGKQFNQVLQTKEMMSRGMDKGRIASALKLQPFIAGKLMTQARQFSRKQLLGYVEFCVETEEDVKSGRLTDRVAVEMVIVKESGMEQAES